jgi:DNA-binding NarL/FixJ family response regulator
MPNGQEVIDEVVAEFPDAKILVVSALRGEALIDCVTAGAADYLSKPLTFNNPVFVEHFVNIANRIVGWCLDETELQFELRNS